MRKPANLLLLLLFATGVSWAGIPDLNTYKWGKISVPENFSNPGSNTIEIYWEKLPALSSEAQAIVMINGGPGFTHDSFHNVGTDGGFNKDWFDALRSDFDVYYFDQRGTGNSGPLKSSRTGHEDLYQYGTENICRDIEELRKQVIGKDRIAVFGESYGGLIAQTYSIMFPTSVSRLIIHDSSPNHDFYTELAKNFSGLVERLDLEKHPGLKADFQKVLQRISDGTLTASPAVPLDRDSFLSGCSPFLYARKGQAALAVMLKELAATGHSEILDHLIAAGVFIVPISQIGWDNPVFATLFTTFLVSGLEFQDEVAIGQISNASPTAPFDLGWSERAQYRLRRDLMNDLGMKAQALFDVTPRLSEIRVPTLVFVGAYDPIAPVEYASIIEKGIGSPARKIVLQESGHAGFIEENDRVVTEVRNFLLGASTASSTEPRFSIETTSGESGGKRNSPTPAEIVEVYREAVRMNPWF